MPSSALLATGKILVGKIKRVSLLGDKRALKFAQDETSLKVMLPAQKPGSYPYVLKLVGLNHR